MANTVSLFFQYAVVEFLEENNQISAIPIKWLFKENNIQRAYWFPSKWTNSRRFKALTELHDVREDFTVVDGAVKILSVHSKLLYIFPVTFFL